MGVSNNPVGHETTIGPSCNANSIGINVGVLLEHQVSELHDVIIIDGTVLSSNIGKLVTFSVTAARIAEEDEIALVGPILHFMKKDGAKYGLWTSMNVQDGWVLLPRHVVHR